MDMLQPEFVDVPQVLIVESVDCESKQVQQQVQQELIQMPVVMEEKMVVKVPVDRIKGSDFEAVRFRVVVPKPLLAGHGGHRPTTRVCCRRTKLVADRHDKYVEHDMIVVGQVEEDGEWVRLGAGLFLPMRFGGFKLLEPMPLQEVDCFRPP
jgi:hypothetical protein